MNEQAFADSALFSRIRPWKEFRTGAAHIFPTESSLRWFIRTHEPELVASGSLLKLPRGNFVDPVAFQAVAINLMRHRSDLGAGA